MINLRYHIVSLTAVFLAIGIGLTLGSTFLDRATVENLDGQLQNLETRLADRDEQIQELQGQLERSEALQTALDEQGSALLTDRLDDVPVVVLASAGVDEADVDGVLEALQTAGADVRGRWWLTERFLLSSGGDVTDLAAALGETSGDPARLRRVAIDSLAAELRAAQQVREAAPATEDPGDDPEGDADPLAEDDDEDEPGPDPGADADPRPVPPEDEAAAADGDGDGAEDAVDTDAGFTPRTARALLDAGFLVFDGVPGGPEEPDLPAGVRIVVVGGSSVVPDDLLVQPLVQRLARGVGAPLRTVVASAMGDGTAVSEAVATIREDERLRTLVSTVDGLDHFQGWVATVLAIEDLADGVVGHYGLGAGASALLPPLHDDP
jgi:uncharacterized coiled-coil protein SlyX